MPKSKSCIFTISKIKVIKYNFLSFAFPALEFSQKHDFLVSQSSVDTSFGEVENIYNILWQIYSGQ